MTSSLEIIADSKQWDEIMHSSFPTMQDVYYRAEFFETYAHQYGARPEAVRYEDDSVTIFYPYLVRDIRRISAFSHLTEDLFDITTPYGYGGPLVTVKKQEHAAEGVAAFRSRFEEYAREKQYVTEFIRFHPLIENHRFFDFDPDVVKLGSIAITDLTLSPETLLMRFKSDKRRGIQKAERVGVHVVFVQAISMADIEEFLAIYRDTMDKNTAEEKYYFTKEQLYDLCTALGPEIILVRALFNEICVASYLVFQSGRYLTNYLSGNLQIYHQYYPKNKVIWELVKYGHEQGFHFYNLGGGKESLLSFKAGFSTELKPFFISKKILNQPAYDRLTTSAHLGDVENTFFPAYRHLDLYSHLL